MKPHPPPPIFIIMACRRRLLPLRKNNLKSSSLSLALSFASFAFFASSTMQAKLNRLQAIPQHAQRSKEWYEMRNTLISASDISKAIGTQATKNQLIVAKCDGHQRLQTKNKKEKEDLEKGYLLHDLPPIFAFTQEFLTRFHPVSCRFLHCGDDTNISSPLHWGKKYEPVTVSLYEHLFSTTVGEFGCIRHPHYSFLGASPDGINIDPACQSKFGRMVEVKNVVSRVIDGKPKKEYFAQMQLQMEVCDLDLCDFLETKFIESYQPFLFTKEEVLKNENENENGKKENEVTNEELKEVNKEELEEELEEEEKGSEEELEELEEKEARRKEEGMIMRGKEEKGIDKKDVQTGRFLHFITRDTQSHLYVYPSARMLPAMATDSKVSQDWEVEMIAYWSTIADFQLVLYWKLEVWSCVEVPRDKDWFAGHVATFQEVWSTVEKERDDISLYQHRHPVKRPRNILPPSCLISSQDILNMSQKGKSKKVV